MISFPCPSPCCWYVDVVSLPLVGDNFSSSVLVVVIILVALLIIVIMGRRDDLIVVYPRLILIVRSDGVVVGPTEFGQLSRDAF